MRFLPALSFTLLVLLAASPLPAQELIFGRTFDEQGNLQQAAETFRYKGQERILALKMEAQQRVPSDTMYVIMKDLNGTAGRFYMKRAQNNQHAHALLRIQRPGIYRVYVYDPSNRRRHYAYGRLFVTSAKLPSKRALVARQRQILVKRGLLEPRDQDQQAQSTASSNPSEASDQQQTGKGATTASTSDEAASSSAGEAQESASSTTTASSSSGSQQREQPEPAQQKQESSKGSDEDLPTPDMGEDPFSGSFGDSFGSSDIEDDMEDFGSMEEEMGELPDLGEEDQLLDNMDQELEEYEGQKKPEGFEEGEFESYDEMDDEFDFEIEDF